MVVETKSTKHLREKSIGRNKENEDLSKDTSSLYYFKNYSYNCYNQ